MVLTFLLSLLVRSWGQFWTDFGSILDPKIVWKSVPGALLKLLRIMFVFCCFPDPQKINFLSNMAPTWPDFGPQDGPKLGPKWTQNQPKNGLRGEISSGTDFGPILDRSWTDFDRFWDDFWSILGRCWIDFWLNFDRIEEDSWSIVKLSSATRMLDFLKNSWENWGFAASSPGRCWAPPC